MMLGLTVQEMVGLEGKRADNFVFNIGKLKAGQILHFTAMLDTVFEIADGWTYEISSKP